jgi:hypothetical protein
MVRASMVDSHCTVAIMAVDAVERPAGRKSLPAGRSFVGYDVA